MAMYIRNEKAKVRVFQRMKQEPPKAAARRMMCQKMIMYITTVIIT